MLKFLYAQIGIYVSCIAGAFVSTNPSERLGGIALIVSEGEGDQQRPVSVLSGWMSDGAAQRLVPVGNPIRTRLRGAVLILKTN